MGADFGILKKISVCLGCFDIDSKHRNKPKQTKTDQNKPEFFVVARNKTDFV
jgi:hypothetical protein